VLNAYCYSKIGDEQIHQRIKNWILKTSNQEKFLSYFTQRADVHNPDLIKKELDDTNIIEARNQFSCCIGYFDLALSCSLKNEEITQCLEFILEKEETAPLLLLKLKPPEVAENHRTAHQNIYKRIENHFFENLMIILICFRMTNSGRKIAFIQDF